MLPPYGFTGKVHHLDSRVGGTYRMPFTNFTTGSSHYFCGTELHITQKGIPAIILTEACYMGCQE